MDDWKDRLKAEYAQTKERYEKLKAFNNHIAVQMHLHPTDFSDVETYHFELCKEQQHYMGVYLHYLELRADLYDIDLKGECEQ